MRFTLLLLILALIRATTAAAASFSCDRPLQFSLADVMAAPGGIETYMQGLHQDALRSAMFSQLDPERILVVKQMAGSEIGREWVLIFPVGTTARKGLPNGNSADGASKYAHELIRPVEYMVLKRAKGVLSAVKLIPSTSIDSAFDAVALITSDHRTIKRYWDAEHRRLFRTRQINMTSTEIVARFEELVLEADVDLRRAYRRNEDHFLAELMLNPSHFKAIGPSHVIEVRERKRSYLAFLGLQPPFAPFVSQPNGAPSDVIDMRTGDLERVSHFEELTLTPASGNRLINLLVQDRVHPEAVRQTLFALDPLGPSAPITEVEERYFANHPLRAFVRLAVRRKILFSPY